LHVLLPSRGLPTVLNVGPTMRGARASWLLYLCPAGWRRTACSRLRLGAAAQPCIEPGLRQLCRVGGTVVTAVARQLRAATKHRS